MPASPHKEGVEGEAPKTQLYPAPVEPEVSLPGAPLHAASEEGGAGVAVSGEGFGVAHVYEQELPGVSARHMRRELDEIVLASARTHESASSNVMGIGFGSAEEELEAELSQDTHEYENAASKSGGFSIDGFLFGSGTNIFSILADPELESTWERVNIKEADLVVACLVQRDSVGLCRYMAKHSSQVPIMAVCSNNTGTPTHLASCPSPLRLCTLAALAA